MESGIKPPSIRRLAVLGGSFDPIHIGHLGIAEEAREAFELDRVMFVPAPRPPHKGARELAPEADRMEMVRAAARSNPRFLTSGIEMGRPGPSYTFDTLEEISRGFPGTELYFLIGGDSISDLHLWYRAGELVERFNFITVSRPGAPAPDYAGLARSFGEACADRLRRNFLAAGPYNVSATDVRARVAAGKSVRYLVPREVERYIYKRGLYLA